jgi:phage terminase small subunit
MSTKKKEVKLTAKQEMFCKEYMIDLNATQAAIRAGYSPKTAVVIGCENLIKPNIAECIQELMAKRSEKTGITAEWVLKHIEELTEALLVGEDPSKAYKGLELAGRHLKMFTDGLQVTGTVAITRIERKIV